MKMSKRDGLSSDANQKKGRTYLYAGAGLILLLLSLLYYFLGPGTLPFIKSATSGSQSADDTKMTSTTPSLNTANTSAGVTSDDFTLSPEQESTNFWIGLGLAVGSNIFIGSSFILKKLGLLSVGKKEGGVRAGQGGHKYLLEWRWWSGMSLMMFGEVMNFVAYSFAPASLVTPLGALSVIFSALLASYFLKEGLNLLGKLGCGLCIVGSTMMVLHAPKAQEIQNMEELLNIVKEPGILVLVGVIIVAAAVTIIFIEPRYGQDHVVVYVFICSSLGSLTVQGCKGLGVAIMETIAGRNEFTNWLTYVMLAIVVINILFQLNYLNKALDSFNTAVVTPTYYVMFSSFVILVSLVLFKEFLEMSPEDIVGDLCGFLTIVGGIFLLNAFKDMDITYHNLPKAKKQGGTPEEEKDKSKNSFGVTHDHNNVFEFDENASIDESFGLLNDESHDYSPEDTSNLIERKPYYDNPGYEVDDVKIKIGANPKKAQNNGDVTHF